MDVASQSGIESSGRFLLVKKRSIESKRICRKADDEFETVNAVIMCFASLAGEFGVFVHRGIGWMRNGVAMTKILDAE